MSKFVIRLCAIILLLAGIACIRAGIVGLRGHALLSPQFTTCAKLADKGPGANTNLTITDVHPLINQVVVIGGDGKEAWTDTYIPLVPSGAGLNGPFQVLLHSKIVNTSRDLRAFKKTDRINGIADSKASEVGPKVTPLLQKAYPNLDLSTCYVVQHDAVAISKTAGAFVCLLGSIMIAAAIALVVKMLPRKRTTVMTAGAVEPTPPNIPAT